MSTSASIPPVTALSSNTTTNTKPPITTSSNNPAAITATNNNNNVSSSGAASQLKPPPPAKAAAPLQPICNKSNNNNNKQETGGTAASSTSSSKPNVASSKTTAASTISNNKNGSNKKQPNPSSSVASSSEEATAAGTKRPLHRVGKNGEQLSEKKLRRLEKNRLSARECRRRKREATEDMQRQINLLEGENLRLRLQLQVGEEAEVSNQEEQQKLTEGLDELLRSGASESEIYAKIEEYKEKFADYGRDRRSGIEFHLRNIERLLQPTQTTSFVLTTLHTASNTSSSSSFSSSNHHHPSHSLDTTTPAAAGSSATAIPTSTTSAVHTTSTMTNAFTTAENINSSIDSQKPPPVASAAAAVASVSAPAESTTNATPAGPTGALPPTPDLKSLFQHLVNILEVSPEQAAALKDSRFVAKEMDDCLGASLDVLKELRTRLTQCGQDLEQEFNTIRQILTPTQAAKFLVWVANNKACMHMLNELWNKVYPTSSGSGADEPESP